MVKLIILHLMNVPDSIRTVPSFLPERLPLRRPLDQLTPVPTPMLSPKPRDPTVLTDLHRRVRQTHERLPQQVNAMLDVDRRGHHRQIFYNEFLPSDTGLKRRPVALADPFLSRLS